VAEPITRNAYAILGVAPECEDAEIVAAYRTMARRFHPDIAGEAATERMIRVNAAFERLRTPERRAGYDLELERSGIPRPRRANHTAASAAHTSTKPNPRPATDGYVPPPGPNGERDGTGGAGTPPGRPSGSVLNFGRHVGWSIGEIARVDPGYLVWLEDRTEGRPYLEEIARILRPTGSRADPGPVSGRPSRGSG
jgi:curved DNA-binding protein CbpA